MKSNLRQIRVFMSVIMLGMIINNSIIYAQNNEADFQVEVTQDGTGVVIINYIGRNTIVNVPATIQGMPVREIASNAFPNHHILPITRVVIPEGVIIIRDRAFAGSGSGMRALISISIPNSVTSIGEWAFSSCSALTTISIPNNVTSISSYAFYRCSSLTTISIPNNVTSIQEYAFAYCNLISVTLPERLISIGDFVFFNNRNLTSVIIPNSVTSIGGGAFANSGIISMTWSRNVTSIDSNYDNDWPSTEFGMFQGCTNLRTVIIPEGVNIINRYAFRGCSSLNSVSLPSTIRVINMGAFSNCISLNEIIIPESVNRIEFNNYSSAIFSGCRNLPLVSQALLRRLGYSGSF